MKTNKIYLTKKNPLRFALPVGAAVALLATAVWLTASWQGQEYWVLDTDATTGMNLADVPMTKMRANLANASTAYISGDTVPTGYLSEPVRAGTFLATSIVESNPPGELAKVVVATSSTLPDSIRPASHVQVWVATRFGTEYGPASILVESAEVVRKINPDTVFKADKPEIEIQVSVDALPGLLDALANDSAIYLVANS